jgi:hypothetical protein
VKFVGLERKLAEHWFSFADFGVLSASLVWTLLNYCGKDHPNFKYAVLPTAFDHSFFLLTPLSVQIPEIVKHFAALGCANIHSGGNTLDFNFYGRPTVTISTLADEPEIILWNDSRFTCLEDFLAAFEDFVSRLMQQYDLEYEWALSAQEIREPVENIPSHDEYESSSDDDSTKDRDSSTAKAALREACFSGKTSEVLNILLGSPDLTSRALYQAAFFKQYDLLRVIWDKMSPPELYSNHVSRALMLVACDGNSDFIIEMAKKMDCFAHESVKALAVHAAYFGREDILRAVTVPPDVDSPHAVVSILRGYVDHPALGSDGFGVLPLLAAIARVPPNQQPQIMQHLSTYFETVSMKLDYHGVHSVCFVGRHSCPDLKRLVQKLIRVNGVGLDIMVQSFQSEMDEATFWGLVEMTGISTDQVAKALTELHFAMISNVPRLLPSHGQLLAPLIASSLQSGWSQLFEAFSSDLDYSFRDRTGNTFLHITVGSLLDSSCFRVALRRGVDPNCRNEKGDTPLHALMACKDWIDIVECTKALIASGADCYAINSEGDPVIGTATPETLLLLHTSGEFPQLFEPQLVSAAFQRFLERRNFACIALLIDWEVPVPLLADGRTILHVIASYHNSELLNKAILRFPHFINAEALNGYSPLRCAIEAGQSVGADIIFRHGGKYSKDDVAYEKLLSVAIEASQLTLLTSLLTAEFVHSVSPAALKRSLLLAAGHCSYFKITGAVCIGVSS